MAEIIGKRRKQKKEMLVYIVGEWRNMKSHYDSYVLMAQIATGYHKRIGPLAMPAALLRPWKS